MLRPDIFGVHKVMEPYNTATLVRGHAYTQPAWFYWEGHIGELENLAWFVWQLNPRGSPEQEAKAPPPPKINPDTVQNLTMMEKWTLEREL